MKLSNLKISSHISIYATLSKMADISFLNDTVGYIKQYLKRRYDADNIGIADMS